MNINNIAERAHNHAVKCGFYKDDAEIAIFEKVNEEAHELMDSINNRRYSKIEKFHAQFGKSDIAFPQVFIKSFDGMIKNSIGDEMADNIILLLSSASELGIDIERHIEAKMKYNELREDHK